MLALRLLGPLALTLNGQERDLGGNRQRVVLAMLALNANRVTPIEQLIDAVWDTEPPTTARAQIQICISALRRILTDTGGTATIRTRAPGYLLEIAEPDLDTTQFASLVTSARAHVDADRTSEAVATLRSALSLWRGQALSGLASELVRRGAAQLEDERLAAIMERIRLDLALGRHEEIVGELFALVKEHPLRERLYEFLMLALYRSGRQAEALEVCRRARATMMEELGIELGQGVRRLETAILNRDPELDVTPVEQAPARRNPNPTEQQFVVPRRLPASIADFTGRQVQLAEITRVLTDDDDDEDVRYGMRVVAISGKGGVGKSTLALRAAHELRDIYPDGHLYGDLESPNGQDRVRGMLAKFLRALGVDGNGIPDDEEERADLYRSRMASKRVLVVLDGAANEEQVLPLLPAGPGCAVIVTSRAPLPGLPGAHLVDIDVFDVDRSLEMLNKIIGPSRAETEPDAANELVRLCGGLPLAIRIAGARLASRPHWRIDVLVARLRHSVRRLDELSYRGLVLRSNIGLSYRTLPPVARTLFRRFSLITTADFPAWTSAVLLDVDPFDAFEVLESLVEAQLLDTVQYPGEKLRYRFHDLIRVFAVERLADEETEAERDEVTERLLGAWLARAEHAHRKEYGGDYTILHGTSARWDGALEVEEIDEMGDQIEWLESERRSLVSAVHLAADHRMSEVCWDLALTSVTLFEVKGHFDDWRETAERALTTAEEAGNRRGQAAMLYTLGSMHLFQFRLDEAERYLLAAKELFEAERDEHGGALVLRHLGTVNRVRNRTDAMRDRYEAALAKMRSVGDLVGEAHILQSLAKLWIDEGDAETARGMLETALERFRRVGYLRGEAQALNRSAELFLLTNEVDRAHQALNRVLLIVRDIGDRIGEAAALCRLGVVRQRTGRLDNAETTLQHALSLAEQVGQRLVAGQAHHALGEIALARGQSAAGAEHVEAAHALFAELGSTVWQAKALILRSDVHQGLGEDGAAARDLEAAIDLLSRVDSVEANRLREELEQNRGNAIFR
ncbi:AfsR/SARP family transcriptional regulator [Actinophytocola sediminis]